MSAPRPSLEALLALPPAALAGALRQDAGRTARWMHDMACHGLVEAQTILGQMLLDGRGTPADPAAARRWFALAAQAGHAPAANMLGRCLERGWGGAADTAAAARHYRAAAEAGLDWGQYNLANMLLRGRGLARDVPQALAWFTAAAGQGHAKSMNLVGRFLEEGWTGPPDREAACHWYRRAAEGGDFRGQYNFATLLADAGALDAACPWFERARAAGSLDFRRLAAEQLMERPEPPLRRIGLTIAAGCCRGGAGEDYHRYGVALAGLGRSRDAAAWLRMAMKAGHAAAGPALAALLAGQPAEPGWRAVWRRITQRRRGRT